jgi:hypothetical protein
MPIQHLIATAKASAAFKSDVVRFADGLPADRIRTVRHAPRIKVLRLLTQLLHAEPHLEIERVVVDAWSGCSDFRGIITVTTPDALMAFRFRWDCSWRAEQEGWFDAFQLPDQIRAAHEFGWRCFSQWETEAAQDATPAGDFATH